MFWCFPCWVNISGDNILKYFSYVSQEVGLDNSCSWNCQILFSGKKIIRLHNILKIKMYLFLLFRLKVLDGTLSNMDNLRHFLADQEVVLGAQESMSSEPRVLKSQRNELQVRIGLFKEEYLMIKLGLLST